MQGNSPWDIKGAVLELDSTLEAPAESKDPSAQSGTQNN